LEAKKAILEISYEMITNHILPNIHVPNISLTLLRSLSGSNVNNENVADGQTGEKPKVGTNKLTLPRSRSVSVVDDVMSRMLEL
jgi:hypothetical protein